MRLETTVSRGDLLALEWELVTDWGGGVGQQLVMGGGVGGGGGTLLVSWKEAHFLSMGWGWRPTCPGARVGESRLLGPWRVMRLGLDCIAPE